MTATENFRQLYLKNYFATAICGLTFFMPLVPKILPWIAFIITLLFLLEENVKSVLTKICNSKYPLLFIAVYLYYLIGMSYSENKSFGWNDLGMKLSLFIFPFLLPGEKINLSTNLRWVFNSFIAGCLLSSIILIFRACYLYFAKDQNAFFYENFSFYMHPSYLALYFDFAIACLLLGGKEVNTFLTYQKIIFISILSIAVIMLSSKAGTLGIVMVFLVSFIILAVSRKRAKFIFLLVLAPVSIYFIMNFFIDPQQNRFKTSEQALSKKGLDRNSTESSTVRLAVWKVATNIIKQHPVFGVGTGDIKDELISAYQQNGIEGALAKRLNAHNQFLQTTIALGILGFLLLAASLAVPLVRAFVFKNWIYVVFLLLIIFNFLFESMLERQDGIIFYAFFNSLFFYEMENKAGKENLL